MPEFKVKCEYLKKFKRKFFRDQELKTYHAFSVVNPEIIPNEYVYFAEKESKPCFIFISDDLVKRIGIDFGERIRDYEFVINLGEEKVANFDTNKSNTMVLKTKDYWENTIQKIGFWDEENYFHELKKSTKSSKNSPNQAQNKSNWINIILICLPFLAFFLFFYLLIKLINKKQK